MTAEPQAAALPDEAQREAIERELDATMLVEAAAGTGKTTAMIRRMVALLAEGRCTIGTLAAVTFTRKAAAELRSRFQARLEREADQARGERRTRLVGALDHVEQCFIGTIHAFCGRLLRERPIEAGVDVGFEELDEEAEMRLRLDAWREHVAALYARNDPLLRELDDLRLEIGTLRATYVAFADYLDVEHWPAAGGGIDAGAAAAARAALDEIAGELEAVAGDLPRHGGNDRLIPWCRELPRRLRNLPRSSVADLIDLLEECCSVRQYVYKAWPTRELGKRLWQRWNAFREAHAEPLVEQRRHRRYRPALAVLEGAAETYRRLRERHGVLHFQDLLMKAAALLRDRPHVRPYFRRRFTHLLVDEFQDTDPVQAQVMMLLTADDPHERDWRRCRPRPGSLFVVGDPKQSIYRFRRADIVTYNQVRRIIERVGRVEELSTNFRSMPQLIEWFNTASGELFPAVAGDYAPADRPMRAARPDSGGGGLAGVLRLDVPGEKASETRAAEAGLIARLIRRAIDERVTVPRGDDELAAGRPPGATPGDFLVLSWRRQPLFGIAQKLRESGLPVEVTGGTAVNEVQEVALLRTALAAVAEPDNPVALVGALRSELFGVSDTALYRYARAGGRFTIFAEPKDAPAGADGILEALARLRRHARWLAQLQPAAAIERMAVDLGLFARAAAAPGGADQAGALAKAIELVRRTARRHWSASELAAYLNELVFQETGWEQRHDGLPARPHDEAVRVMNLHQAKGLEAPVVILADGLGGGGGGSINLCVERRADRVEGYLAVRDRGVRGARALLAVPADWKAREQEEDRFLCAEEDRLLYVAATRAASLLVICRPGRRPRWQKLVDLVPQRSVLQPPGPLDVAAAAGPPLADDAAAAFARDAAQRRQRARNASYEVRRLKQAAVRGAARGSGREHGTELGTVLHLLLEAAMARPRGDLRGLARTALAEQDLDDRQCDELVETVRAVTGSDLWRRAAAAERTLTEVPVQVPAREAVPVVVRGVVDLAFREAGGWVIVDYKTDDRPDRPLDDLVVRYAPQVRAYAEAWAAATGEPVREAGLFFVHSRRYRTVVGAADRAVRE